MTYPIASLTDYPPTHIENGHDEFNVLQLTDLHLYFHTAGHVAEQPTTPLVNQQSFEHCLQYALNEDRRCDLILVTGDLVSKVDTKIYDYIFNRLQQTGIPFACISGNHDVTDEVDSHLPYAQRSYAAHDPDSRLLSRHIIKANNWHLLLLDSSVPGHVYGHIGEDNMVWLSQTLASINTPVIIAMHHHVLPMTATWINKHITQDANAFLQCVAQYRKVKAIVTGHVHQQFASHFKDLLVYATPATCYQFKPGCEEFTLDDNAAPGYRWLQLAQDGGLSSWVTRLADQP